MAKRGKRISRICLTCEQNFQVTPSRYSLKERKGLYCSRKCISVGKIRTLATRKKLSKANLGKKLSKETRAKMSLRSRDFFQEIGLRGLISQQSSKEPTSIEKMVYKYLGSQGVIFEAQKLINDKFLVDAYIPSLNLIIEVDGDYWHSLDRVMKKDKAENAYLRKCGFNLLRLNETEIKNGYFKERMVI